jgi:hypothetical protein
MLGMVTSLLQPLAAKGMQGMEQRRGVPRGRRQEPGLKIQPEEDEPQGGSDIM